MGPGPSSASSDKAHVPIQRLQRDIQALVNQPVTYPQTSTETYGRVLCGLESNTPLLLKGERPRAYQASSARTTRPCTSVSLKSRPW